MDVQKIKDEAFKEALAELKKENADNPKVLNRIKSYEETNGKRKTREISKQDC